MLLPRGEEMARGHEVAQSCDANGNVMDRDHTNPIFKTRMHQVKFARGQVTKLNSQCIAKSIYTHTAGRQSITSNTITKKF